MHWYRYVYTNAAGNQPVFVTLTQFALACLFNISKYNQKTQTQMFSQLDEYKTLRHCNRSTGIDYPPV